MIDKPVAPLQSPWGWTIVGAAVGAAIFSCLGFYVVVEEACLLGRPMFARCHTFGHAASAVLGHVPIFGTIAAVVGALSGVGLWALLAMLRRLRNERRGPNNERLARN